MARHGMGFFDSKGQYFKTPSEATESDLAALLGRIGDGDSLAPGIAVMLLERRAEVERIFAEHDTMLAHKESADQAAVDLADNVTALPGIDIDPDNQSAG